MSEPINYMLDYEPLTPDKRVREQSEPVGLKNIGNSKTLLPYS